LNLNHSAKILRKSLTTTDGSYTKLIELKVDWERQTLSLHETKTKAKPHLRLKVSTCGVTFTGTNMAFQLPDDKTATLTVSASDAAGVPAKYDGKPIFEVSDSTILVLTESEDGFSATIAPANPVVIGSATVSVTIDADLGEGVTAVVGTLDVEVVGGQATSVAINAVINP
jgi:hypothetical protein